MGLKFNVRFEGMDAIKDKLAESCTKAEHILAQQVAKDTSPFVPASSELNLDKMTTVEGSSVIYPGPYARYLYHGKAMVYPETGGPIAPLGENKVVTDKNLVFRKDVHPMAQSHWFEASKAQNMDKWERVAQKAVEKGLDK